ncbi:MAG: hypothetical protein ABGX16_11245 [Pirellulales bacterium]
MKAVVCSTPKGKDSQMALGNHPFETANLWPLDMSAAKTGTLSLMILPGADRLADRLVGRLACIWQILNAGNRLPVAG